MNGRWLQLKSARVEAAGAMLLAGRAYPNQTPEVGMPSPLSQAKPMGDANPSRPQLPPKAKLSQAAFSLVELMVVLGIIGLMATMSGPILKALNQNSGLSAASRQLMDDISLARMRAINNRTTVYMVFAPTNLVPALQQIKAKYPDVKSNPRAYKQFTNLISGQFSAYALIAARTVGDQPGRSTPRYLTEWRTLPEGFYIAPSKFAAPDVSVWRLINPTNRPFAYTQLPFPTADCPTNYLPYIAFNSYGQLVPPVPTQYPDEIIPLTRGSIMFDKDESGMNKLNSADFRETPPGNATNLFHRVHIYWQTGRAKVEKLEIQ